MTGKARRLIEKVVGRVRALNITYDTLLPIPLLPAFLYSAAFTWHLSIGSFALMPIALFAINYRLRLMKPPSKFFFVWSMWSCSLLYIIFQSNISMTELLPEENLLFVVLLVMTVLFFLKAKRNAPSRLLGTPNPEETAILTGGAELDEESSCDGIEAGRGGGSLTECQHCQRPTPPRTYHCYRCQVCVPQLDHHNIWLDCCIGAPNRKYFLLGCVFGLLTAILHANLTMTSICRPYLVTSFLGIHILMPEDCSEVYDQYDIAVCFVASLYCLLIGCCLLIVLLHQLFMISRGVTGFESRQKVSVRPGNNLLRNWRQFFVRI